MVRNFMHALLVVVIMVKNESDTIISTLQPFFDGGVRHFLVYDTGSTDDTLAIARDFFAKNSMCEAQVIQEDFIDFAQSRNRALSLAHAQFPHAFFFIMPDAEWYIKNVDGLLAFCEEHKNSRCPAYTLRVSSIQHTLYATRLIRNVSDAHFVGVVHEYVDASDTLGRLPESIYFNLQQSQAGQARTKVRLVRDKDLLYAAYKKNMHDPRTLFYLAQTCACLGELEQAYVFYQLRTQEKGWEEEDFTAWCRLGAVINELMRLGKKDETAWSQARDCYLHAYALRPTRAEPLVCLAAYYFSKKNFELCYMFARAACELPYPVGDSLSVANEMYDRHRWDLLRKSQEVLP